MRSAAHTEHRAVRSLHHQHDPSAAWPPRKMKRLAFCATLHCLAAGALGEVRTAPSIRVRTCTSTCVKRSASGRECRVRDRARQQHRATGCSNPKGA